MKKIQLRRIIASGKFIPEIDGLRFIAVMSVLLYHINIFIQDKNTHIYAVNQDRSFTPNFVYNGSLGVELFFVLSGFVLGLFFARAYRFDNPISLKSYFLRRLTRLEPPYIIALIGFFFGSVYLAKSLPIQEAFNSLISSIFYVHNIVYPNTYPKILAVAWSLEVEVQFYILAPILGLIFKFKNGIKRKSILLSLCILFPIASYFLPLTFVSLYNYMAYFLLGFLITDIYLDQKDSTRTNDLAFVSTIALGLLLFAFFYLKEVNDLFIQTCYTYLHLIILFGIMYIGLIKKKVGFLRLSWVSNIGGACYSIYLLHYPIISLFGNILVKFQFTQNRLVDNLIFGLILFMVVMFISGIFYLLIERPCMDKHWVKKLIARIPIVRK